MHGNIDGPSQQMFRTFNISSLMNLTVELVTHSFLIAKIVREETMNGISSYEFKKVKRELDESNKSLESALVANSSLTTQIKELLDMHAQCKLICC